MSATGSMPPGHVRVATTTPVAMSAAAEGASESRKSRPQLASALDEAAGETEAMRDRVRSRAYGQIQRLMSLKVT
jgi:hypothetical protein